MHSDPITLADIRRVVAGTAMAPALDFMMANDHESRLTALRKAIDYACNELELNRKALQHIGEDAITLQICQMLRTGCFQAEHDAHVSGHCDIVVKGPDMFLWLAEAKIHSAYDWLDQGFRQLATRYSTGVPGQDQGEILIYCFVKNAAEVLQTWRQRLEDGNPGVHTQDSPCGSALLFLSTHQHDGSGLNFYTRHKAVALHWSPA